MRQQQRQILLQWNEDWRGYTEIENGSHDFSETKTKERIDLKWKVEIENELICVFVNEIECEWYLNER